MKETVGGLGERMGLGESTEDVSSREIKKKERVEHCSKALWLRSAREKGMGVKQQR